MTSWQSRVRLMVFLCWGNFTLHRSVCSRSNSIYRRSQRQPSSIEGSRKNGGRSGSYIFGNIFRWRLYFLYFQGRIFCKLFVETCKFRGGGGGYPLPPV